MKNNIIDVVKNSKVTHPIAVAATKGNRYWQDFFTVSEDYSSLQFLNLSNPRLNVAF